MIDVAGLSFTYAHAAARALSDLTFHVGPGEIFGFLGPSGAGKSTTQRILIGLLKGYQGTVHLFGRDLAVWGHDLYERIGVSFEMPNHFLKLTARENLSYFASLYSYPTLAPAAALAMVGLADDADRPVGQFSKGMKERLNVARALLHNPELLFLDEPTAGLDPTTARAMKDLIQEQQDAGKTIFLTTHDMTVADELCDRVAFLVGGRIQTVDAPRALKEQYGQARVRVEYRVNSHRETQEFPLADLGANDAFLSLLRSGQVRTMHSQEATLEDVFIRMTGRGLQ